MSKRQSISEFFRNTLGAKLSNTRWSWGATNALTGEVFLRVWADEFATVQGRECIAIFGKEWESDSPGKPERMRHVDLLRAGAEGYGALCWATDPNTEGTRKILRFDHDTLLQFGELIETPSLTYAHLVARVAVSHIASRPSGESSVIPDLKAILRRRGDATSRETLVDARLGQGLFRAEVLKLWNNRCCVTGCITREAIRASHIKPWRESSNEERLDPRNGLPLVATLDALFDAGLISFADDGSMLVAQQMRKAERAILGITGLRLRKNVVSETAAYLSFHRGSCFADKDSF